MTIKNTIPIIQPTADTNSKNEVIMALRVNRAGAQDRWSSGAVAAGTKWVNNTASTDTDWATPTAAAEDMWAAGVAEAAAEGRFSAGVEATGNTGFRARITEVGSTAYTTRVTGTAVRERYRAAMTPFWDALEALTLPPRTGDLATDIINRVTPVCAAMQEVAGTT